MTAIAVDDELPALEHLKHVLTEVEEISDTAAFSSPADALEWLTWNTADVAFLDVCMNQYSGILLAGQIRECCPGCAVIFVTAYSEYALDAFRIHASGYLLKPVCSQDIRGELIYLQQSLPVAPHVSRKIQVQCFGNFEVFSGAVPLKFRYRKSKELFAYLIDRRGALCELGELCGVLWEDRPNSPNIKGQLRHLISDLSAALNAADCLDILVKRRGLIAVIPARLNCDYYSWLKGDSQAVNTYTGEYMAQYSWAEMTIGRLDRSN